MEVENQNDDELRQLTQAKAAEMRSPDLSPQETAARRFEQIAASIEVDASKRGAAIAIINGHAGLIIAALRRCDYGGIAALLNSFDYAYRFAGLATPVVERSPRELYAGLFSRWGWGGEESDAAIARIKPRATVAIDWDHVVIDGQRITREAIRLGLKPRYSPLSDAEWLQRFGQMRKAVFVHGDICFSGLGSL